jgi:hypothetical protein
MWRVHGMLRERRDLRENCLNGTIPTALEGVTLFFRKFRRLLCVRWFSHCECTHVHTVHVAAQSKTITEHAVYAALLVIGISALAECFRRYYFRSKLRGIFVLGRTPVE